MARPAPGAPARGGAPAASTPLARGGVSRHTLSLALRRDTTVIDLDAAVDRMHQLDDERLAAFVHDLDEALANHPDGLFDDDVQTAISVAGAARILLRQRRASASRTRLTNIVHALTSATEN